MATSNILLSWIAARIYNLDSERFQKASLDSRGKGWTETWGYEDDEISDDALLLNGRIDEESIAQLLSTPYPQVEVVLAQYRPAWFEQMLLRVAGIPHIVINSNHISNEATGQLPYLRDCMPSKPPVLIGRNHPSNIKKSDSVMNNSIFTYLQNYRNVNLDEEAGLTTDQQRVLSRCFQYIISLELSIIFKYLTYGDSDAWKQVYREQYIAASSIVELSEKRQLGYEKRGGWFKELYGRFQASMERNIERQRLQGLGRHGQRISTSELLERANEAYIAIDRQLQIIMKEGDQTYSSNIYLLGTDKPALVDVLLWSHLAEALGDVHLVVVLASYPRLVKYFQDMYHAYFSSIEGKSDTGHAWKDWNNHQNYLNAFQKIPALTECDPAQYSVMTDAFHLMEKLSLQKQGLKEVLDTIKAARKRENQPKARKPKSFLLYQWCMGQTSEKEYRVEDGAKDSAQRKKLLRDQARNDQIWLSGIFGISAMAIILIRGRT